MTPAQNNLSRLARAKNHRAAPAWDRILGDPHSRSILGPTIPISSLPTDHTPLRVSQAPTTGIVRRDTSASAPPTPPQPTSARVVNAQRTKTAGAPPRRTIATADRRSNQNMTTPHPLNSPQNHTQ